MTYFEKYNLAYHHINKTGGTSVKTLLCKLLGDFSTLHFKSNHESLKAKLNYCGKDFFAKLNVFTTVRNPLARFVSIYEFRRSKNSVEKEVLLAKNNYFNDWLVKVLDTETISRNLQISGNVPSNLTIIKLENIDTELINYLSGIGIEIKNIPKLNKNRHKPYDTYYDEALIDMVIAKETWLVENYYKELVNGRKNS